MFEIGRYRTAAGNEPFTEWLSDLRDRQARARILAGQTVIVLLCGGDKRKQDAHIKKAVELCQEYGNRRKRDPRAKS